MYYKDFKNKIWFSASCLILFLAFGCTIENQQRTFTSEVENLSTSGCHIQLFRTPTSLPFDSIFIDSGEKKVICDYFGFGFAGFACNDDVLLVQFKFENEMGYNCIFESSDMPDNSLCFMDGKNIFTAPRLPNNGDGVIFTITQEDFENARELP